MKRNINVVFRVGLAFIAFAAVFGVAVAVTYLGCFGLQHRRHETLALGVLLFVWSLLAYFPARHLYVALTTKIFKDGIHCNSCGYNLTGNLSGICPECGLTVPPQVRHALLAMAPPADTSAGAAQAVGRHRFMAGVLLGAFAGSAAWLGVGWSHKQPRSLSDRDFEATSSPFAFVRWSPESELLGIDPNSVFGVLDGKVHLRFTFHSGDRLVLDSVGVFDEDGRAWFDVDIATHQYSIDLYSPESGKKPHTSIYSTARDALADHRRNWSTGEVLCIRGPVEWGACVASSKPADGTE